MDTTLAEQAYANVPYSTKANVAIHCGISPHPVQLAFGLLPEAEPGGIPSRCLPELLEDQGYSNAYFLASIEEFENFRGLVNNFGYEYLDSPESRKEEYEDGSEEADAGSSFEDDLLKPSEEWLKKQKESNQPFLATYFTASPHYPYEGCQERYGSEDFAEDDELNRYLNCIRYQDFFLKNLFDQYKELGLYENTVFIVLADHGEAFGEHGLRTHPLVPYEEALKIPLIIHDPKRFENGERVKVPVSQLDILPTIADLLGYEIEGGAYQGSSLLGPLPEDRTLYFSCWGVEACLASREGSEKYIYHYGSQPDELFDLSKDPLERENLADERPEEVDERRKEILAWRSSIDAMYRGPQE